MRKTIAILVVFVLFVSQSTNAQTVLIDPTGDGGFENGTTFAANGWTVVNGSNATSDYNRWVVGVNGTHTNGSYCAYISSGSSGSYGTNANYAYTGSSGDVCHIYKDISFPAGEELITLTFKWKSRGHTDNSDNLQVFLTPTSVTPVEDVNLSSSYRIGQSSYYNVTTWQDATIVIDPSYAGTTVRLVFSWKNNTLNTTTPPAAIDEISLESDASNMTYSSSTTVQASTANVCPGTLNNQIVCVQVVTADGLSNPLTADSFTFNTGSGTTDVADISNAKLFYTGTSSSFSTTTQVGSTNNSPNGSFTISPSQTLALGTNYFWLTYDISPSATIGNSVDCDCNSITVSSTSYTPTATNPAGVRNIPSGCPPGNDNCSNAWEIPLVGTISASNVNAATGIQPDDPNPVFEATCNSSSDNVIFFKFTTTTAGDYQVCFSNLSCNTSSGIQASIFDTDQCYTTNHWPVEIACVEPMNTNNFCISASGLAASTTYMMSVDGYSGCKCSFNVGVIQENILPVSLGSFTANMFDCSVKLEWTTFSEINSDRFLILRKSPDGYDIIGEVAASGNSNIKNNYEFIDKNPLRGHNYYLLRQIDYDGTSENLGIRNVFYDCENNEINIISQNGFIKIESNNYVENAQLEIISADGRVICKKSFSGYSLEFCTENMSKGIYFVKFVNWPKTLSQKIYLY
ncbi:MAG TPA: BNR-repeat neuraminidase N-terminal domain-containing protein [Bacteroidales bacterium]|nr:BNR-repeat neuraminidase N-terminal domain-containing protein [Bacteroidales bacterium]